MNLTQLVGTLHYIRRGRTSNLEHPGYLLQKVNFLSLGYLTKKQNILLD